MEHFERAHTGSLQKERNGSWTMRVSLAGRIYSRSASTKDGERARAALCGFVAEVERANSAVREASPLWREWERYANSAEASVLSRDALGGRRRAWLRFSVWMGRAHPGVADARSVTRAMAAEYLRIFGAGRSSATFNLCVCALRSVFRALLAGFGAASVNSRALLAGSGETAANPFDGIPARFPDTRPRRELAAEEVRRLVASADRMGGEWPRLVAIAVYTGLRLGDCCRLRWENIDLARKMIRIVPRKTRRFAFGRIVAIPVHARLLSVLAATPAAARTGFVMPGIARNYAERRWLVSKGLAAVFDGAGIVRSVMYEGRNRLTPFATFHSLRHSFVSFAANAGVPLAVVQAIVGHSSSAMTRHYYHADEQSLRRAVDAIPSFAADGTESPDRPPCAHSQKLPAKPPRQISTGSFAPRSYESLNAAESPRQYESCSYESLNAAESPRQYEHCSYDSLNAAKSPRQYEPCSYESANAAESPRQYESCSYESDGSDTAALRLGPGAIRKRSPSIAQRLIRIGRLLESGLVSAEEYSRLRERILAEV